MSKTRKPPSQRQLRVAEQVRHVLAAELLRGDYTMEDPELRGISVTVSEVEISPDLKKAKAFVMPLGGQDQEAVVKALNAISHHFNHVVAKELTTKYTPKIWFQIDTSFDEADKINRLLKS